MNAPEASADVETTDRMPAALNSAETKLVYLYLGIADGATIDRIAAALDVRRITLYPLLRALEEADLVDRSGETYHRYDRLGREKPARDP